MKRLFVSMMVVLCLVSASVSVVVAAESKPVATKSAPISINTAGVTELTTLPGIGEVTAKRIIAWRKENGPFKSADDLQKVKGIGPKSVQKIQPLIAFK